MVGQSRSLEIFFCVPKLRDPMVIRSTFLFSHWNRESKTDDPIIISSFQKVEKEMFNRHQFLFHT